MPRPPLVLLAAVFLAASARGTATGACAPIPAAETGTARKVALLVGINAYEDSRIRVLRGGLNDVEKMWDVLVGGFDFPPGHICVLRNEEATRDGILAAVRNHLVANARPGDVVVFYYSGHGAQVLDQAGGDEPDGLDETIVPYDSNMSGDRDIRDDTINELIREVAGKTENVTFIFDACSSGSASRGAGLEKRVDRGLTPRGASRGAEPRSSQMKEGDGPEYTLIAAALSAELAREHEADNGVVYGALTYFLTDALSRAPKGTELTYRDVMDVVTQNVTAHHRYQHPQLEGRADRVVFGVGELPQQKFVLVTPAEEDERGVFLEAGRIQGVSEGSVFEIFPRGSRKFEPPEVALAKATVVEALPRRSKAVLDRDTSIEPASRAVERKHKYGKRRLFVRFESPEGSALLRSIQDDLTQFDFVHIANGGERYHLLVEHLGDDITIEAADSGFVARIPAGRSDARRAVVAGVKIWAKWFNVLSIHNPSPAPNVQIRFRVEAETSRGAPRLPFAHVGRPDAELYEGEIIKCVIESRASTNLYLTMLDLSTDGTVGHVYPENGMQLILPRGETLVLRLGTFVPPARDSVTDVLKVFATASPLDFSFVEQQPLSRGERETTPVGSDPLEELVAEAALGARGPTDPVRLDLWTSAERVIRVVRRPGAPSGN